MTSRNSISIDLHGTTVAEAVQIVKDVLKEEVPTAARPLKIITGRGKHSTNGVGVLGPAVNNALLEEGWDVAKWDGGLIIRGRTSRRL
jgi:DNA-nicking Smr family endonuclease